MQVYREKLNSILLFPTIREKGRFSFSARTLKKRLWGIRAGKCLARELRKPFNISDKAVKSRLTPKIVPLFKSLKEVVLDKTIKYDKFFFSSFLFMFLLQKGWVETHLKFQLGFPLKDPKKWYEFAIYSGYE